MVKDVERKRSLLARLTFGSIASQINITLKERRIQIHENSR